MVYKLLNVSYLNDYFLGDKEAVSTFLEMFGSSVADDLKSMGIAIDLEKIDQIKKNAHKLKSSYRYLGVESLGRLFEDMENTVEKNNNFVELKLLFQTGLRMNAEVINEINQFLNQN